MSQKLILGLDIGTSSVRAALYDLKGNILPETLVKNERSLTVTRDGGFEIDADVAFNQVVATIDDVLAKTKTVEGQIENVASCAFWHSLVGVDAKGKPTTKVLGWGDTRSRKYTATLHKQLDETAIHDRTGARFHSSFWPAKLLWLRKENRKPFDRTAKWLSFSDYVSMKLHAAHPLEKILPSIRLSKQEWQHAGVPRTSVSMASATGLFNIRECVWDEELLDFLGLHKFYFSRIVDDESRDELNREYRRRWPRLKGSWWFPSIGDGAANNIGAGCVTKERAALMVGTSGAMRVAYEGKPPAKIPDGLWCYRIDRRHVIIGGALSDGGGLYQWLRENLRLDLRAEAEMSKRPPGANGLVFLPFFAGERSTGYYEDATGAILGLRSSTDSTDILRAALESVAFRFAEIFDRLNVVCKIREVVASGGAIDESPVWTQIISDVLGRDITVSDASETSMRGAVLLALETTGKIKLLDKVSTKKGKQFQSDRSRRAAYAAARKRHNETYKLLMDREK